LAGLLRKSLVPDLIAQADGVGLAHPADKGDLNLSLFLYAIKENADYRSNEMVDRGGSELRFPPVALDLYYLVTAHSASDIISRGADEHRILGKTLQTFHDHPVLKGDDLEGSLAGTDQTIRIVKQDLQLETIVSFFPDTPYKLSLSYTVGPVFVDSNRTRSVSRVAERKVKLHDKG
jgi:hypothetical protein